MHLIENVSLYEISLVEEPADSYCVVSIIE